MVAVSGALSPIVHDLGTGEVVVASTTSGHLRCYQHDSIWCDHIRDVINTMGDKDSIFVELLGMGSRVAPVQQIEVPLLPTYNIYAEVFLEPISNESAKAYLLEVGDETGGADGTFLGFFNIGEGRRQLRAMVLEWVKPLAGNPDFPDRWSRCRSARHGYAQQARLSRECKDDPKLKVAHWWCIFMYHKCYHCFAIEGPDEVWADDLIPK